MIQQILKMWWMLSWRLALVTTIIFRWDLLPVGILVTLAIAVALGLCKLTIRTFPLLAVFSGLSPIITFEENLNRPPFSKDVISVGSRDSASQNGPLTGFEPRNLKDVQLAKTFRMTGTPGSGLSESGFDDRAISLGQAGELNFAKALSVQKQANNVSLLTSFYSFWSVAMPSEKSASEPDSTLNTDIDAVIIVNETIYLVDLKNYKGGNVIYRTNGDDFETFDGVTGEHVGKAKKMSKNMQIATERFRKHFPSYNVQARVVLMPTDKGEGVIENVFWPGGIPAVNLREFLAELSSRTVTDVPGYPAYALSKLVKN